MKAAIYAGPREIQVEDVPDPRIEQPTDVIARITHACICGSDLWFYRGLVDTWKPGFRTGHEWIGVVEDVGSDVMNVRRGDVVVAPFVFSDGTCENCRAGVQTSCEQGGAWGGGDNDGGQAEAIRAPFADGTLVAIPSDVAEDETTLRALLPLTDVMGTGHHAAVSAGVGPGSTAVVVGDGAVGLCAVLAAQRLRADRIVLVGHHEDRLKLALTFGATDVVATKGEAAVDEVRQLTGGGAGSVMECVGNQDSLDAAAEMARPGGTVGFVGVPHGVKAAPIRRMFSHNIALSGGVAPVRHYLPELMRDVLEGVIDPSPVLDLTVDLDDVATGYRAMDTRDAIKVMVRP